MYTYTCTGLAFIDIIAKVYVFNNLLKGVILVLFALFGFTPGLGSLRCIKPVDPFFFFFFLAILLTRVQVSLKESSDLDAKAGRLP